MRNRLFIAITAIRQKLRQSMIPNGYSERCRKAGNLLWSIGNIKRRWKGWSLEEGLLAMEFLFIS